MKTYTTDLSQFICLILLCCCTPSYGQVTFIAPTAEIDFGTSSYTAPIRVASFDEIVAAQFTVSWDSTVLRFKQVGDLGFEDLSIGRHFASNTMGEGTLNLAYEDADLQGETLPDSAVLFSITFDVVGNPESSSAISFVDFPVAREIADTSFEVIPSFYVNGRLSIGPSESTTSVQRIDKDALAINQLSPNPSTGRTLLTYFVRKAQPVDLLLYNGTGQLVRKLPLQATVGANQFTLDVTDLDLQGAHQLVLRAEEFIATRQILFH